MSNLYYFCLFIYLLIYLMTYPASREFIKGYASRELTLSHVIKIHAYIIFIRKQ